MTGLPGVRVPANEQSTDSDDISSMGGLEDTRNRGIPKAEAGVILFCPRRLILKSKGDSYIPLRFLHIFIYAPHSIFILTTSSGVGFSMRESLPFDQPLSFENVLLLTTWSDVVYYTMIMHHARRKKLLGMPLKELERLQNDVQAIIDEIEALPEKREIDIMADHTGDPKMIAEIINREQGEGKWTQWESIYCCAERCPNCPHGPFMFVYRETKKGKIRIVDRGIPAFDIRVLKEMEKDIKPPIFAGTMEEFKEWREKHTGES